MWQVFSTAAEELSKRGESLTLQELNQIRLANKSADVLDYLRIRAAINENAYSKFPGLLRELLSDNPGSLQGLQAELSRSPQFLSKLPDNVAHDCFLILKDHKNGGEIPRLLDLLARGKDQDELWEDWKSSDDPFSPESSDPILWGFNIRSAFVRELFGIPNAYGNCFVRLPEFYYQGKKAKDCTNTLSWVPKPSLWNDFPVMQGKHWELLNEFSASLAEIYHSNGSDAFIVEFLKLRGVDVTKDSFNASAKCLKDKRRIIRYLSWEFVGPKLPYLPGTWEPLVYDSESAAEFLRAYEMQRKYTGNEKWALPGPALTKADYLTVQSVLEKDKDKSFVELQKSSDFRGTEIPWRNDHEFATTI